MTWKPSTFWIWHPCSVVTMSTQLYLRICLTVGFLSLNWDGISMYLSPLSGGVNYYSAVNSVEHSGAAWLFCSGRCQFRPVTTFALIWLGQIPLASVREAENARTYQPSSNFGGLKPEKYHFWHEFGYSKEVSCLCLWELEVVLQSRDLLEPCLACHHHLGWCLFPLLTLSLSWKMLGFMASHLTQGWKES